ncbi:MAG: hypothetical protein WDN66_02875 [Candidatus Saccharibacteria bacterium]
MYHAVDPNNASTIDGGEDNVTPTQLSSELAAVKASGIKVETMKAALADVKTPDLNIKMMLIPRQKVNS